MPVARPKRRKITRLFKNRIVNVETRVTTRALAYTYLESNPSARVLVDSGNSSVLNGVYEKWGTYIRRSSEFDWNNATVGTVISVADANKNYSCTQAVTSSGWGNASLTDSMQEAPPGYFPGLAGIENIGYGTRAQISPNYNTVPPDYRIFNINFPPLVRSGGTVIVDRVSRKVNFTSAWDYSPHTPLDLNGDGIYETNAGDEIFIGGAWNQGNVFNIIYISLYDKNNNLLGPGKNVNSFELTEKNLDATTFVQI